MEKEIKLKIAGIVIRMKSRFAKEKISKKEQKDLFYGRFKSFIYKGKKAADIEIEVDIRQALPRIKKSKDIFITYHPQDGKENWRLFKNRNLYIYECRLKTKKQVMLINKNLNRVKAYLLPKKGKLFVWSFTSIVYDFLQVLLINYCAMKKTGIFIHGIGVKDTDKRGFLFAGPSGAGKTTTARLWHNHSRAFVLNDDRMIARKFGNKFFIYGSPWHGDFSDYLASKVGRALLDKLFFIYHAKKNILSKISEKEAFKLLYTSSFPAFWDKDCLENIASLNTDLINSVKCLKLGFTKNKSIIKFIRNA
ncbi:MAG: hypothetical protein JW946_01455 [Candidatus Omnitrophica bacterium]|nr:hypothetical protein [Candidatus Omnitrophota bacterium]